MMRHVLPLALAASALSLGALAQDVPEQNLEKGELPDASSAQQGARLLLSAASAGDPILARAFFFPAPAFLVLKDAKNPAGYHELLMRAFDEDVRALAKTLGNEPCALETLTLGRCRWIVPGAQANKLAYWSCRRTMLKARCGDRLRTCEIHTLINWADTWYVTHLAAPR
ncbi:MAG: hypothetical protein MUC50_08665 [Myxococcota bacterium]|jgi:hypothetical protein|nr:hypothetical protein [Myxococcota bacterium]